MPFDVHWNHFGAKIKFENFDKKLNFSKFKVLILPNLNSFGINISFWALEPF